jgi:hypothetical protein
MKATLQMSFEYLRLYTNAYAFQATTCRAISSRYKDPQEPNGQQLGEVGSLPDARFIYESVDAAKSLLTIINKFRATLPNCEPSYCVNSAVFLYKVSQFEGCVDSFANRFPRRGRSGF